MRTTITKTVMAAFLSAMALLFAVGCGEKEPPVISVSSVSLSKTSITIKEGSSESLSATVSPSDAQNKAVSWSSSNSSVATVDNSGRVTGVKAGSATITVTTSDGGKTATCSVTVEANIIAVTGVTLDKATAQIPLGGDVTLAATVAPADATDKSVTWTSSDEAVAKVSGGKVTAVAVGKATITAKTNDGGKTATCEVSVIKPVESVTISDAETMVPVEGEVSLTVTVTPEDATIKDIEWSSSDESIAKVDATGKVTGVAEGTATITAKTVEGGKTATCKVTVGPKEVPVEGVEFAEAEVSVIEGESAIVSVNFTPAGATNKNVTYESSDEEVATVDAEGNVTGVKPGQATITVTTEDGGKTAECVVTVEKAPVKVTGVELNYKERTINIGNAGTLIATVLPKDATNKNVTWTVSDESVLKVQDGVVTPKKEGTATVTVTTEDGGFTATCEITATAKVIAVSGVKLDKTSLSVISGGTAQLKATISPANATNTELTWTSSKTSVATVDAAGNITAVTPGSATITAKSANGKTATCAVTVSERYFVYYNNAAAGSSLKYTLGADPNNYIKFKVYDKLTGNYLALGGLNNVTVTSSTTAVANATGSSADTKLVTAYKAGTTTLTFKHSGRAFKTISLTVSSPTINLLYSSTLSSLNVTSAQVPDILTIYKGSTVYVRFYDKDNNKMITSGYSASSNYPNVAKATVNSSGYVVIEAVNGGNCTVTVSSGNTSKSFSVRVPITYALTTSTTANVPLQSPQGIKEGAEIKVYFWNVTNNIRTTFQTNSTQVKVSSSNSSVASVTFYGSYISIKGVGDGAAIIKVKIDDTFGGTMPEKSYNINVAGNYSVYWLRKRQSTNTQIQLPPSGTTGEETLVERSSTSDTRIYPCKKSSSLSNIITNTSIYTSRYSYTYTNSNSAVVDVEAKSDGTNQWFELRGKSDGTANVTFTYADKLAGISSTYSIKVRVRAKNNNINLVAEWSYKSIAGQATSSCKVGETEHWYTADSSTGTLVPYKTRYLTVTSEGDSSIAQTYSAYYSAEPNKSKYGYFIESKGKKAGKCNPKVLFDNGIERKTYTLSLLVEN